MKQILINNWQHFISAAGAIGSLVGAWIAWLQYRKAAESAKQARSSEIQLKRALRANELSRDSQDIKGHVKRLSRYTRRGIKRGGSIGTNLNEDIDRLIMFRNELSSLPRYSNRFYEQLNEIQLQATSVDFKNVSEDECISSINSIIEMLNQIAVSIEREVSL